MMQKQDVRQITSKRGTEDSDWIWGVASSFIISAVIVAGYHFLYAMPAHRALQEPVVIDYTAISNAKLAMLTEKVRVSGGTFMITPEELEGFINAFQTELCVQAQGRTVFEAGTVATDALDITEAVAKALHVDLTKSLGNSLERVADDVLRPQRSGE